MKFSVPLTETHTYSRKCLPYACTYKLGYRNNIFVCVFFPNPAKQENEELQSNLSHANQSIARLNDLLSQTKEEAEEEAKQQTQKYQQEIQKCQQEMSNLVSDVMDEVISFA